MLKRTFSTVGLAALTVGAMATGAAAQDSTMTLSGQLDELNGSGGSGTVTMELNESTNEATIRIEGNGFLAGSPHAQHIHGVESGDSVCPTLEQDEDGDGLVNTPEGATVYGPIEASLTTEGDTSPDSALAVERFPTYDDGVYERTVQLDSDVADNLDRYHVVIHGVDVNGNGEYDAEAGQSPLDEALPLEATLPAACGTLTATASGGVDTGAGGTADSGADPIALSAVGAVAIGGLALGLRRRSQTI
ncbi:MAG: hypothetical protein WEB09_11480 [Nitriliruptor sp.]